MSTAGSLYGQDREDVVQSAFILFAERNRFDHPAKRYIEFLLLEAAQEEGIFSSKTDSLDLLLKQGCDHSLSDSLLRNQQRERIHEAMLPASTQVRRAVDLVLDGFSMLEAAQSVGMRPYQFSRALKRLGKFSSKSKASSENSLAEYENE